MCPSPLRAGGQIVRLGTKEKLSKNCTQVRGVALAGRALASWPAHQEQKADTQSQSVIKIIFKKRNREEKHIFYKPSRAMCSFNPCHKIKDSTRPGAAGRGKWKDTVQSFSLE